MNTNTVKFNTRLNKDATPVETVADLDFEGVTDEQLRNLAERSIIIMVQAQYRAAETVPATDTVHVADLFKREAKGKKTSPEKVKAAYDKLSPDEQAIVLAYLENANRK